MCADLRGHQRRTKRAALKMSNVNPWHQYYMYSPLYIWFHACYPWRMVRRGFWIRLVEAAWRQKPVVWLAGVRRSGKTVLASSLARTSYYDCEMPSTRVAMRDPESFLSGNRGKRIVLDEIHRLDNPSELLKIAADHFRDIRVLATGSSTLGATRKFSDTLVGRKTNVWLTPMNSHDLADFRRPDLDHRITHGGLPPIFAARTLREQDF